MWRELLSWYLAPWRRMGRGEFGVWLVVVSLPSLVLAVAGSVESGSGWLMPAVVLMDGVREAQGGNMAGLLARLGEVEGQMEVLEQGGAGFPWGVVVNNLLMLLMVPLCRMRLVDMGRSVRRAWVWAVLFNVAAVDALLEAFGLPGVPLGWAFGLLSFGGYIWLCMAASAPRVAPYERIPGRQE